jgi:hypothetical protein
MAWLGDLWLLLVGLRMRLLARELPGVLACEDMERVLPGVEDIMETRRLAGVRTSWFVSAWLGCAAHPQPPCASRTGLERLALLYESGLSRRGVERPRKPDTHASTHAFAALSRHTCGAPPPATGGQVKMINGVVPQRSPRPAFRRRDLRNAPR